jgi:long-chain fatty acid transport protein
MPSFIGFNQTVGPGKLAFVIAIEDYQLTDQNDNITNISTETDKVMNYRRQLTREEASYLIGPSYAYPITPRISIGASVFVSYQREKGMTLEYIEYAPENSGKYFIQGGYITRGNLGIKPKIGVMWAPFDVWTLGFSAGMNIPFYGNGIFESVSVPKRNSSTGVITTPDGSVQNDVTKNSIGNVYSRKVSPLELAWGNAFFLSKKVILAVDAYFYTPDFSNLEYVTQFTWNASLGLEVYATEKFPIRLGLFTNNANTPKVRMGAKDQPNHVDQYGASLGFSILGPQSSITLSASGMYGHGQGQIVSNSTNIQDINQWSVTAYLAASYQL